MSFAVKKGAPHLDFWPRGKHVLTLCDRVVEADFEGWWHLGTLISFALNTVNASWSDSGRDRVDLRTHFENIVRR